MNTQKPTIESAQSTAITVPPIKMIVNRLKALDENALRQLAKDSGVGFSTLQKIRIGVTQNPGIETVRAFFPLLPG